MMLNRPGQAIVLHLRSDGKAGYNMGLSVSSRTLTRYVSCLITLIPLQIFSEAATQEIMRPL